MLKLQDPGFGTRRYSDDAYELAKGLGKQKAHVVRKLEANFDKERLSKMETHLTVMGGNHKNVAQTVKTYMLDYKTAGALAGGASYDF